MKRLRGKNAGEHLVPRQYCNDWIMADTEDGRGVIVSPLAIRLDPEDYAFFQPGSPHAGSFWREFELTDDDRFRKVPRRHASRFEHPAGPPHVAQDGPADPDADTGHGNPAENR